MRKRTFASIAAAAILSAAGALAANNPPLSGAWNIASSGSAATSGELLFRMTPADGGDPIEVTVSIQSGTSDIGVARDIRRTLSSQLRADRFNIQLGQGANVLVTDPHAKPNFSLELINSDVENLRVAVQSVTPTASPTVQGQATPAVAPSPPSPAAPGNVLPPAIAAPPADTATPANTAPPSNASQPAAPPPNATSGGAPATAPAPNATPGGASASTPPPTL